MYYVIADYNHRKIRKIVVTGNPSDFWSIRLLCRELKSPRYNNSTHTHTWRGYVTCNFNQESKRIWNANNLCMIQIQTENIYSS